MRRGLKNVFSHAAAPSRFCADLQTRTKAVRSFSEMFAGLRRVPTRISGSVIGADMLGLMSDYLKRLVQNNVAAAPEDNRSIFRSAFTDPLASTGSMHSSTDDARIASPHRSALRFPAEAMSSRRQTPPVGFELELPDAGASHPFMPLPGSSGRPAVGLDETNDSDRNVIANRDTHVPSPQRSTRWTTSILSRKLDEYWKLSRHEEHFVAPPVPVGPVASRSRREGFGTPSMLGPRERSWVQATAGEVAERLRAFTSGRGIEAPALSVRETKDPELSETFRVHNVFNITAKSGADGDGSLDDLSDKVAGILREQALQHGIDIT